MRVLVTGGAGYIGSHLVRHLEQEGFVPIIYDNFSRGHMKAVEGYKIIVGDIRDKMLIERVVKEENVLAAIHFAAHSQVGESVGNPSIYYENNCLGGLCLLRALIDGGVRNFIFSSSAAVYGEPGKTPIEENHPINPTNPYGETKAFMERVLGAYDRAYGFHSVSLRYFNAAGAARGGLIGEDHEPETHLIPLVLKTILGQREKLIVYGGDYPTKDGTAVRDYIHVDDLAHAHVLALKYLLNKGQVTVYNLGNGKGFSVMDVIKAAEEVSGEKVSYEIGPRREGDPAILVASSSKAQKELNWKPGLPDLKDIIQSAWVWHKNHPTGYEKITAPKKM